MLRRALLPYYISANFRFVRFLRQHFFCFICRFLSFYLLLRVLPDLRRQDNLSFYFLLAFFRFFLQISFLCFFLSQFCWFEHCFAAPATSFDAAAAAGLLSHIVKLSSL